MSLLLAVQQKRKAFHESKQKNLNQGKPATEKPNNDTEPGTVSTLNFEHISLNKIVFIDHWSYISGEASNWSCVCVCASVWAHTQQLLVGIS